MWSRLEKRIFEPVDIASLAVFRVIFGLAVVVGVVRYIAYGWVDTLYIEPSYHFTYWGFDWIAPWPGEWMYVHYAVMGLLGLCIAAGLFYRASISLFFVMFTFTELIDKTAYLNHYYFISLAALLMIFMPLERAWSLDARRKPEIESQSAPCWVLWTLRLQIGLVYFFAGIAKLEGDWLLDAQPMSIWLATKTDMAIIGPLFDYAWIAHAMSVAGFVFDLTVFFFLLWPTSRALAYVAVVVFHAATGMLFNIGMFPWIMIGLTPIFFAPDWPRRVWHRVRQGQPWPRHSTIATDGEDRGGVNARTRSLGITLLALYFAVQLAVPLRHWLYPGDVLWNQEGWRFSWRVMLIEKSGHLKYRVRDPQTGKRWVEYPGEYLTPRQFQLASGSPDMILQLAHDIADRYRADGHPKIEVYADAYASLNAHPSAQLVDPTVNLAKEPRGLAHFDWVTPMNPAAK